MNNLLYYIYIMNNLLYYSLNNEGKHLTDLSKWKVDRKYRDMKNGS